ncbi:helix-turn-helix domain-containing protein [Taylorella equigenitalis]|uniref:helix-turn-helix domain-containing protein n=1 Tax=Taylorella equigenitalis TaxID=29575 RepID=UPI000408D0A8|nr:helix-turn-helix domain-containing protein [Taylorella equigenitalis]WDU53876.1 helix-turn-helix domain-containing protein [Taylorella equigenitalis]
MLKHLVAKELSPNCVSCKVGRFCLPNGKLPNSLKITDDIIVKERIRVPKKEALFKTGDAFTSLYAIRSGSFKTLIEYSNGHSQITGFFYRDEVLGLDALSHKVHASYAVAMEDSEVCLLAVKDVEHMIDEYTEVRDVMVDIVGSEISRSHNMILTLGSLNAEQKLAMFLQDTAQKQETMGYSPKNFVLRMRREDIGNYLGLTLETVSRLFSKFSKEGIIHIQNKNVQILEPEKLTAIQKSEPIQF